MPCARIHTGFDPQGSHAALYTCDTDCEEHTGVLGTRPVSATMTLLAVRDDRIREGNLQMEGVCAGVMKLELDIFIDEWSTVRR